MDSDVELLTVEDLNESSLDHETHIDIDIIGLEDEEIQAPALPDDKDRHLFVSYSSEDSERVWPIVDALEKRFNVKCVYSERDFQPGMDITENIKIGMRRSLKCLLMVSSNFTQSGWCKYEREFAFVQSVESGSNRVIPVKLEECEMPSTLVTLTYVDATQPFCDVPKEVMQALNTPDINFPDQAKENTAKYENGFSKRIQAKRESLCLCRPAKYKFEYDEFFIEDFQRCNIQIPGHLLYEAITILNRCKAVKYFDFIGSPGRLCCWSLIAFLLICICLLLEAFIEFIHKGRFSKVQKEYEETYIFPRFSAGTVVVGFLLWLLIYGVSACIAFCRHGKMALNVHKKLWKEVSRMCLQHNTILLYWSSVSSCPTDYLYRLIQSKPKTRKENELEAKDRFLLQTAAFEMIEQYLSRMHPYKALDFERLPNAPSKRHSVMKGKECLCQCLEQYI